MWRSLIARQINGKNYFCKLRMVSTGNVQPKLYALQYEYVADAFEKRKPYREAHLAMVSEQTKKGSIVLAGALDNPPTGGLLIIRNLSREDVEAFVRQDPYVINGVVKKYTIKPYMAVIGDALLNNDLIQI